VAREIGGIVQLVVFVDISADVASLKAIQKMVALKGRVRNLARRFGNSIGIDKLGIRPRDDNEISHQELYRSLRSEITASLEMWVLNDNVATIRGPCIVKTPLLYLLLKLLSWLCSQFPPGPIHPKIQYYTSPAFSLWLTETLPKLLTTREAQS
jgi:hypothetical protein